CRPRRERPVGPQRGHLRAVQQGAPTRRVRWPHDGVPHLRHGQLRAGDGHHPPGPGGSRAEASRRAVLIGTGFSYSSTRRRPRAPSSFVADACRMHPSDLFAPAFPAPPAFGQARTARTDSSVDSAADIDALLRLVASGGPAEPRRRLIADAAPAAALAAGPSRWHQCGLGASQQRALRQPDGRTLEAAHAWLAQPGHHLLGWHHPDYAPLLRRTPHPPLALFVAGDAALAWHPAVAIVGSRSPTPAGREHAGAFARSLAAAGLRVTSGLAAGVDTAAHHATLTAGGRTVAVLGTSPDVPYPRSDNVLHAAIVAEGAAISE